MVDIHCHILPAIDDGSRSMGESLEIIGREAEGGTTRFIATPHVYDGRDVSGSIELAGRIEELRSAVAEAGIQVEVVQGAEVFPTRSAVEGLDRDMPITVGGHRRHMLVDLPMSNFPADLDQILFEIQARNIVPILAHPERTAPFQQDPESLKAYIERGILIQVNAGSLLGRHGPRAKECGLLFLSRHWPHFLASDAHRARPEPFLKQAVSLLGELDPEYVHLVTETCGRAISEGQPVPALPKAPDIPTKKKRKLFGLFG